MDSAHPVGVQTAVLRHLSLAASLTEVAATDIDHVELWAEHLSPADGETAVGDAEAAIADAGVEVSGYGVVDLEDTGQARPHVALADRLGADYLTVNYPPDREDVTTELVELAEEFGVDVAIHNYSSVHHDDLSQVFSSIGDVRSVLSTHDHPRLGLCLDTGHFLVEDVSPGDVVRDLGNRIAAVHLKDTAAAEVEAVPGAGELDLPGVLDLLADHTELHSPLVIEYELEPERATAALREAEGNVRAALASLDE